MGGRVLELSESRAKERNEEVKLCSQALSAYWKGSTTWAGGSRSVTLTGAARRGGPDMTWGQVLCSFPLEVWSKKPGHKDEGSGEAPKWVGLGVCERAPNAGI